jgi:hypothetical protein
MAAFRFKGRRRLASLLRVGGSLPLRRAPDVSGEELELLIEAFAPAVPAAAHHSGHSRGGDFSRWGRRGGSRMLALCGRCWFVPWPPVVG